MQSSLFLKHLPNIMSLSRIVLCYIGMNFFSHQHYILTVIILFIGWMTDFWDGRVARYLNVQSKLGRWIDHATDRISLFWIYYILYPINPYFVLLAVPGVLNSLVQILFALQFQEEVRVTQTDRVWFLLSTLVFPSWIFVQLAFPFYPFSLLENMNYLIMGVGIILGFISIAQYLKQYTVRLLKK